MGVQTHYMDSTRHAPEGTARSLLFLCVALVLWAALLFGVSAAEQPEYRRGVVASGHPLATAAGLDAFGRGGNAIDAAVAVGLTLGVVDTQNSGIGGGCFMIIRLANGKVYALDGRETAPAAARRDMFLRNGEADTHLSQTGALASGVPGELAAFDYAVRKFGKLRLSELLLPAAALAESGFPIGDSYSKRLAEVADEMRRFEASTAIFFKSGKPLRTGSVLRQSDLASTYRAIAVTGVKWFYEGPFARHTDEWMRKNGGVLSAGDFAAYRVVLREPVQSTYRGCTVFSFPPPSSGGVHLAQMLNIVEQFDLKSFEPAVRLHVMAEAMKLAFADRAYWLGDPAFANVPRGLLSKTYATNLAARINLDRAVTVPEHNLPPAWQTDLFKKHTTHFSVADTEGNWVACTATINTSFGSKVVIPGTGVVLNNQMDDFSIQPGVPNYFGLVGAEANSIMPGKRPLSSMTPTIVLKDGKPIAALGAAGGPKIISTVFEELIDMLDLGMNAEEAVRAPRIHHQWSPDQLTIETTLPDQLAGELQRLGHKLDRQAPFSTSQIVTLDESGRLSGSADPRSGGSAAGL